jgi:hypothetical protein
MVLKIEKSTTLYGQLMISSSWDKGLKGQPNSDDQPFILARLF